CISWLTLCYLLWILGAAIGHKNSTFFELLRNIKEENAFNSILLMKTHNASFPLDQEGYNLERSIMEELQVPVLQLDERVSYFVFGKQSNLILSVVHLVGTKLADHDGLLKALVANLHLMTISRVVFMVQYGEADDVFLFKLFVYCWKNNLLNVIAIFDNFELTNTFYSYTHFPNFKLEEQIFEQDTTVFPNRLRNLHGYRLPVAIGGSSPRIIGYYDKRGKTVYKGTVGHFMEVFQQKYNCHFIEPFPANPLAFAPATRVQKYVRNGSVDISMAITFPSIPVRGYSYPIEQMNWCLMLPVEPDIPQSEYYIKVFELQAFLLTLAVLVIISLTLTTALKRFGYLVQWHEYLLHDNCLRGALGQSFYEVFRAPLLVRGIYLQICVLGFLLTAWYNSYFSAYVTSAPKELPYRNYDELMASKLKVVAWEPEHEELVGRIKGFDKYKSMFYLEPDFGKYIAMRDSFNTEYGYMMTTIKWIVINAQQKVFSKPLFRLRTDLCFFNTVPFVFPVHENSIYMESINSLILDLSDMGLIAHWTSSCFSELVESGELNFADLSPRREFRAMELQDLQYIWYGFAFMAALSSSVLLLE
ncbi:hypothetical protein KR222_001956, partial [Zaprionus bogoriensis]